MDASESTLAAPHIESIFNWHQGFGFRAFGEYERVKLQETLATIADGEGITGTEQKGKAAAVEIEIARRFYIVRIRQRARMALDSL